MLFAVEFEDVPVTFGAVVACFDDRLAGRWCGGQVGERLDRHRDHDDVTDRRSVANVEVFEVAATLRRAER